MKENLKKVIILILFISTLGIAFLSLSINSIANPQPKKFTMKDVEFTNYSLKKAIFILDNDTTISKNKINKYDLLNTLSFAAGDMYKYNKIPSEKVKKLKLQIPELQKYYTQDLSYETLSSELKPMINQSLDLLQSYYPNLKKINYSFKLQQDSKTAALESLDKFENVMTKPKKVSEVLRPKDYLIMLTVGISTIMVFSLLFLVLSIIFQKSNTTTYKQREYNQKTPIIEDEESKYVNPKKQRKIRPIKFKTKPKYNQEKIDIINSNYSNRLHSIHSENREFFINENNG